MDDTSDLPDPLPHVAPAFPHMVEAWLVTFSSTNTRAAYRRDLELFVEWLSDGAVHPDDVTPRHVLAFREHCASAMGASASTTNRRLAAVSSFYRHAAVTWSRIDPTEGVGRRAVTSAVTPPLSDAESAAVWRAAVACGDKCAVIVALAMVEGWKTHDLLQLDVTDLVIGGRSVTIDTTARGGGRRSVVDPRTAAALRSHVAGRTSGPLLVADAPTRERARLTRFGVDYLVKRVGERAGLTSPLTITTLRQTYQSRRA